MPNEFNKVFEDLFAQHMISSTDKDYTCTTGQKTIVQFPREEHRRRIIF